MLSANQLSSMERFKQILDSDVAYAVNKFIQATAPSMHNKPSSKVYYHQVMDESVPESSFRLSTSCSSKHVQILNFENEDNQASTQVSLFKFNQNTTQILPLCSQKRLILDTLSTLPYQGGSADPAKALRTVYNYIKATQSCKDAHNVIIFMTESDLRGSKTILEEIANDISLSIKIVFIFVNKAVPQNLSQSNVEERQVVHFKDLHMMERVFDELTRSKEQQMPSIDEVVPQTRKAKVYLSSNSTSWTIDCYILELYEEGNYSSCITKKSRFEEYVLEGLKSETSYKLRACAQYSNGHVSAWTEFTSFATSSPVLIAEWMKDPVMARQKHTEKMKELLDSVPSEIRKMIGSNRLNVAIFGAMQHGKSTLICTASSTFAAKYQTPAKSMYNPNQTVTTEFKEINIMNPPEGPRNNYIKFHDTFGIRCKSNQSYNPNQSLFAESNYAACLGPFLSGRLPPGYQEWERVDESKLLKNTNINNRIHAIAFIVDILAIQQDSQMKIVKEFLEELIQVHGHKPLIIFTKCDVIMQKDLPKNTKPRVKNIFDNKTLDEAIDHFIEKVAVVDRSDIMLFANYTTKYKDEERELDKELLLLDILDTLKQRGESYIDDYFRNHVQVFLENGTYLGNFEMKQRTDSVASYCWRLSELLKNKDYNGNEFSIRYHDNYANKTKTLKESDFDSIQIKDVLSEESEYPRITLASSSDSTLTSNYAPIPTPGSVVRTTPTNTVTPTLHREITQLLLKMEGENDHVGFLENIEPTMKLSTLRTKIQDDCEISSFDFVGAGDESLTLISNIITQLDEGVFECVLKNKESARIDPNAPQMIKIVDVTTDEPLIDVEVSHIGVSLKTLSETIKQKIGKFSFMMVFGDAKAPVKNSYVQTKSLKDLLSGTGSLARVLFVKRG